MKYIEKSTNSLAEYLKNQMYVVVEIKGRKAYINKRLDMDLLNKIQENELNIDLNNEKETIKKVLWNLLVDQERFVVEEFWSIDDKEIKKVLTEIMKKYSELAAPNDKNQFTTFLQKLKLQINYLKQQEENRTKNLFVELNQFKSTEIFKDIENFECSFNNLLEVLKNNNAYVEFQKIAGQPKKIQRILISNNWFFDNKYKEQFKEDVIKLENDKDGLDQYIVSLIDEDFIESYLNAWKQDSILSKRMPIISQCIKSLKHEQYYVFMCTIFTQIEGIIVEAFKNFTPEKKRIQSSYLKDCIMYMEENSQNKDLYFYDFYCNTVLQNFLVGEECLALSRHSIMHGYNINYGTKTNAYKLLILFIYVYDSLEYLTFAK